MCLQLTFEFHPVQSFVCVVYCAFSLLVLCQNLLFCEHRDSLPNVNIHAQYNLELNVVNVQRDDILIVRCVSQIVQST